MTKETKVKVVDFKIYKQIGLIREHKKRKFPKKPPTRRKAKPDGKKK